MYVNTQEHLQICKCCRQPYHPDKVWESEWDALVLGAEKFAICPICGATAPERIIHDRRYQRRWMEAVKQHIFDNPCG